MLQLQNILNLNKIEAVNSKTHNFSVLTTKRQYKAGLKRKVKKKLLTNLGLKTFKFLINIQR